MTSHTIVALANDVDFVYIASIPGGAQLAVSRISRRAGEANALGPTPEIPQRVVTANHSPFVQMAVDDDYLYWSNPRDGAILRASKV